VIQHFSYTFFPFSAFATQLFFIPVMSSKLRNQAPLYTELRLSQGTHYNNLNFKESFYNC